MDWRADRAMVEPEREADGPQRALAALLAAHPDAIVAGLANDGYRIVLPDGFVLGDRQTLAVSPSRATMVDVVVPADRLSVVAAWERTCAHGIGVTAVHALHDPDRRLTLSMFDVRERYGVYVAAMTDDGAERGRDLDVLAGALIVAVRPRQATMHKDMTAFITAVDENVCRMFGWGREQLVGARASEFVHPEDLQRTVTAWMHLMATRCSQRVRFRHRCADGSWLWVELENVHNGAQNADEIDVTARICDISDEMAAHETVRRREQLFSRLAEALPTGVLQLANDGSVAFANTRAGEILQLEVSTATQDPFAGIAPDDRAAVRSAIAAALEHGADGELEVEVLARRAAHGRRCMLTVAAVFDDEGRPGALVCANDVTESARLREELRLQATHDALTGCLNRPAVLRALERLLSEPDGDQLAVIFVDVDNFKPINDRLGHAAGDQLLIAVAHRLRTVLRERDLVARLGGDEFLLVCHGPTKANAAASAQRIAAALAAPFALADTEITLRSSIGIACSEFGLAAEELIARADAAMYQSKRAGQGQPVAFEQPVAERRAPAQKRISDRNV